MWLQIRYFKYCDIEIVKSKLPRDLTLLAFPGYNIILGMDWLSKHHAQVDCKTKMVRYCILEKEGIEFRRGITSVSPYMISRVKARKLLHKGCHGFLAYLINDPTEMKIIDSILVICKFHMYSHRS